MTAIVLAAGKSRRMAASVPKVLLPVSGRPLLSFVLDACQRAGIQRTIVVVGIQKEQVMAAFERAPVEFAVQTEPKGTADAVLACRGLLRDDEECVVLCGDAPLVKPETIRRLAQAREAARADVAVFTAVLADPSGYGRVMRGEDNLVDAIVEERDASEEVRARTEVNSGAYSFCWGRVRPALERIQPSPVTGEYYLTDLVRQTRSRGGRVVAVRAKNPCEMLGANTPEELALLEQELAKSRDDSGG